MLVGKRLGFYHPDDGFTRVKLNIIRVKLCFYPGKNMLVSLPLRSHGIFGTI